MRPVDIVIAVGWAAFWLYWLVAARSIKRGHIAWSRELPIRLAIIALVGLLIRAGAFRHHAATANPWRAAVGLVLLAAGLGFAVWARLHIGRNWGSPMSRKDEPELVTSGPYRLVRHPIYTGILLAVIGTAVAVSWVWLVAAALAAGYFCYSAVVEERDLAVQFADSYAAYRRTSKMFVPYVF